MDNAPKRSRGHPKKNHVLSITLVSFLIGTNRFHYVISNSFDVVNDPGIKKNPFDLPRVSQQVAEALATFSQQSQTASKKTQTRSEKSREDSEWVWIICESIFKQYVFANDERRDREHYSMCIRQEQQVK